MKQLKIKKFILSAALAVGMGVTGIAATAQAAEWEGILTVVCDHPEDQWEYLLTLVSYDTEDKNIFTHTKYLMDIYRCECSYIISIERAVEEEPHDLVYNYSNDRFECTHCDYWE